MRGKMVELGVIDVFRPNGGVADFTDFVIALTGVLAENMQIFAYGYRFDALAL